MERPDPAELAGRLLDALEPPPGRDAREALSRSARERFGVERLVEDLRALYLRELARR